MAVRFDADAEDFNTTTNTFSSPFTATCWVMLSADRNTWSTPWCADDGTVTNVVNLQTNSDGVTMSVWDKTLQTAIGPAMTVGAWYRFGVTHSGTTVTLYHGTQSGALTSVSGTHTISGNLSVLRIGESWVNGEWLNGRVANFKQYSAALTQVEVEAELGQYAPARIANLVRLHPFIVTGTTDYSGNSNTLSGGAATTTEDGPPIPWASGRRPMVTITPRVPTVDVGRDVIGTANFEVAIQAVETGLAITSRAWTVVSGPAEVATTIGTSSLLSWYPATAGVYELEYAVTSTGGSAYDTVYVTVNPGGTVVNTQSVSGTGATLVCTKPTGLAEFDVMLAAQSGDAAEHDEMRPPAGWQPLFEYDVGSGSLHLKGWTLTAGPSEPSTYTFTQGTGSAGAVTITAMRGVVEGGVNAEVSYVATTSATRTAPTIEKAVPGSVLLCGAVADPGAARTWTPPTGMTEQADLQSTTNTTHTVASKLDPGAPTGTKDFTASGLLSAAGGIQWSAVFPMPPDPRRGVDNRSMITFVRTT